MKFILYGLVLGFVLSCSEERQGVPFKVASDQQSMLATPVTIDLGEWSDFGLNTDGQIALFQESASGEKEVPLYRADGQLWFVHHPEKDTDGTSYRLANNVPTDSVTKFLSAHKANGSLRLMYDNMPVVGYRYEMTYPPEGVDSLYKKSGYVHPIRTLAGDTLTRIQPPDHYHHYGLWGPWTHTRIDTTRVDFWNLGEGMGTVLFKEFKETTSGPSMASFTAVQEHIDLKTEDAPQVALEEELQVRLWDLGRDDRYMFDYNSSFISPLEDGILFEAYRYGGGLGLRFTERWTKDNCTVLTSEGLDRLEADGTRARWCIVTGASADGSGTNGILFLSHPGNREHPEPMRVWPLDANGGRGDMFFEFCPIRHNEWPIEPNTPYGLQYRMVVFDGDMSPEEAEDYWQTYANPPKVEFLQN